MPRIDPRPPELFHLEIVYHHHRRGQRYTLWEKGEYSCRKRDRRRRYTVRPTYSFVLWFGESENNARQWIKKWLQFRGLPVVIVECNGNCEPLAACRSERGDEAETRA